MDQKTGSTASAVSAMRSPGLEAQPVLSRKICAMTGASPPNTTVELVLPSARPQSRVLPGNCSALATAPTALTPPARSARTTAATQAIAIDGDVMTANDADGSTMPQSASATRTGRRPKASTASPTSGVIAMTAIAAIVETNNAACSPMPEVVLRNVGT